MKVFCVGAGRTGSLSLSLALKRLGYNVAGQAKRYALIQDWAVRRWGPLLEHCRTAEAFHDAPFSHPFTYVVLDQAFPSSKFILTVRDCSAQWYKSLVGFHSVLTADGKRTPTADDLKAFAGGWLYRTVKILRDVPDDDLYNRETCIRYYERHCESVREYFRFREDLLVLNVSEEDAFPRLCRFLDKPVIEEPFPHTNSTAAWRDHIQGKQ